MIVVEGRIVSRNRPARMVKRSFLKTEKIICNLHIQSDNAHIPFSRAVYDASWIQINSVHTGIFAIDVAEKSLRITDYKLQIANSAEQQIDISKLSQGLYLVKVTDGDSQFVKRFVKE